MKVVKAIIAVVSGWFLAAILVGWILAITIGHSEHGSIGYMIVAGYLGIADVFTHLLILFLRQTKHRS